MLSWGLVGYYFFVVHVVVEKHHVVLGVSWVLLFCRACCSIKTSCCPGG